MRWCIFAAIFVMVFGFEAGRGGEEGVHETPGYILGHDRSGVALINLKDGQKVYLRHHDEGHFWALPLWQSALKKIICVDQKTALGDGGGPILLLPVEKGPPEVLYATPVDFHVEDMTLMPSGKLIVLLSPSPGRDSDSKLIVLDLLSQKSHIIAEANFHVPEWLQPIGEARVLLGKLVKVSNKSSANAWKHIVCVADVKDGSIRELLEVGRAAQCAIGADGKMLFVYDADNESYRVGEADSLKKLDVHGVLPGYTAVNRRISFMGNSEDVLLYRGYSDTRPAGFYTLNIKSGEAVQVSKESVWHPVYVKDRPDISSDREKNKGDK